jgi:hypothetical protein
LETDVQRNLVYPPLDTLKPVATDLWPAAGLVDTKIGCFMKPEVRNATQEV